jgi:ATP-binding cassette subfamily C protein
MREQLWRCWQLLTPAERWRWASTIPLAVGSAILEAAGAASVYTLVRVIGDAAALQQTPILAKLSAYSPWQDHRSLVLLLTLLVALLYCLKNASLAALFWLASKSAGESWASLSRRLLRGYLQAPIAYHLRRNSAEFIHNTVEAADVVFRMVVGPAVSIAAEFLVITGLIVVLLATAPGVTLLAVSLLFVLLLLVTRGTRHMLTRWGSEEQTWRQAVLRTMAQAFEGIKEIKLRNREDFITQRFNREQTAMISVRHRFTTLSAASRLIVETAFVLGILVVVLAVTLTSSGSGDVIPVIGVYAYAGFRVIPSVNRILLHYSYMRYGFPAVGRTYDDLLKCRAFAEANEGRAGVAPLSFHHQVALENLSYVYEESSVPVLRDINLSIQRGESVGLVGSTGAGKTTLINLILGLLHPSAGRILVDGVDVAAALAAWQRKLGYVPQLVYLIDDTLRRNIAFALDDREIDEERVKNAVRKAQLEAFIANLPDGLNTVVGERGIRLSGGERQRVAIARALYFQPEVLVFDEATSSLDPHTERELTRAIDALHGQTTMLLVAHRLTTVQGCDRIVLLHEGRIAATGKFDDLMRDSEEFRRLAAAKQAAAAFG